MLRALVVSLPLLAAGVGCHRGDTAAQPPRSPRGSWDIPKIPIQYGQPSPTYEDKIGHCWKLDLPATRLKPQHGDPGTCL
jgi:hypothetical protein